MITKHLEDHLADFYHRQELRPEKLAELRLLAEGWRATREKAGVDATAHWRGRRMLSVGGVAAVLFLLALGAFYLGRVLRRAPSDELTASALARSIGREIAMNHRKQLELEFLARDYVTLQIQMSKLDFALAPPSKGVTVPLNIAGARYCSIQGQLAAQIRARDPAGLVYTLYETKLTDKLRGAAGEVKSEGVEIRLWSEHGLFYGLAVNEPQSE